MPSNHIIVDLSTAFEKRTHIPHGTVRVERSLIESLARLERNDISFCRFDLSARRFIGVSRQDALAIATASPIVDASREVRISTRSLPVIAQLHALEVWFRQNVRERIRSLRGEFIRKTAAGKDSIFEQGSILLLPGELQRQDFKTLTMLKRERGLRIACVLYDVLDTLPGDDPRAHDPDSTDIPGSEFIMRADLILPISNYSGNELRKHAESRGVALAPMHTIRLGHQIANLPEVSGVDGLMPGRFVLAVGDVTGRKNQKMLADIWTSFAHERTTAPIPLVVAGRVNIDGPPLLAAVRADPKASSVISFLTDVDDAKLQWLYRNCRFTLFPSFSEGFGLPVVESLAFGKPCIASNTTALPEASQGVAIHIDPHDTTAWRHAIERFLDDDAALEQAKADIANRFRLTSWTDTANDVLDAIAEELQRKP